MKRILVIFFMFLSMSKFLFAQFPYYGIKGAIENYHSTAPSSLIVQVESETYKGFAYVHSDKFHNYYCKHVAHKQLHGLKYVKKCYRDIKNNRVFSIHDTDFTVKYEGIQYYQFDSMKLNKQVINDSKNGLEYFICKYFDSTGVINSCNNGEYYSIIKVLFDSNIQTGIDCVWDFLRIQDKRFYQTSCNGITSFKIPEEYRNKSNKKSEDNKQKRVFVSNKNLKKQIQVRQDTEESVTFIVNHLEYKLKKVNGGTFIMGFPLHILDTFDTHYYKDIFLEDCHAMKRVEKWTKPAHDVSISDYYIGETEVTQALWQAVMGYNNSCIKGDSLPIEKVSWRECQKFIRKLNKLTNLQFALPTETQWEYAARGGGKSKGFFYAGSDSINEVAWYEQNSNHTSHAVKSKQANEIGLYDMSGNVGEWCRDVWYRYKYTLLPQTNIFNKQGKRWVKVLRGGSYNRSDAYLVYSRWAGKKNLKYYDIGFRFVLNLSNLPTMKYTIKTKMYMKHVIPF